MNSSIATPIRYRGYTATVDGRVIGKFGRYLKPWLSNSDYEMVCVKDGTKVVRRYVHDLACEAFHGTGPSGQQVAHGDGSKLNNYAENPRWATPLDHQVDRHKRGIATGENNTTRGRAKVIGGDADTIRASDEPVEAVAVRYGISTAPVRDTRMGRTSVRGGS